jgi:hypothetical protein
MEPTKPQGDKLEKQIPGKDIEQQGAQKPPVADDVRRPLQEREKEEELREHGELTEE